MNISLKLLIFCLMVVSASAFTSRAVQAHSLADSLNKVAHSMDVSFEPKNPGTCSGDKCAAGGSY